MQSCVIRVAQTLYDSGCFLYADFGRCLRRLTGLQIFASDFSGPLYQVLQHEAGHFPPVQPFRGGVVHQGNVFRPLYQAVEVVGIDGVLVLDERHAERLAQVVGVKGGLASCLGQFPFVERQDNQGL